MQMHYYAFHASAPTFAEPQEGFLPFPGEMLHSSDFEQRFERSSELGPNQKLILGRMIERVPSGRTAAAALR
jgi:hypothetical protein